jgi:hypothetical protein
MQVTQHRQSIIPPAAVYYDKQTNALTSLSQANGKDLDLKEICVFLGTGFFLGDATFYKDIKAIAPATDYSVDANGILQHKKRYWEWNYNPRDISLKQAVDEYASVFEKIVAEQTKNRKVVLALSGGLDSRTLATALPRGTVCEGYSYEFADSFPETEYGRRIAEICGFPFHKYIIPRGYLWDHIEEMARLNQCCSEFTHPRQAAVVDDVKKYGDIFLLGHWGDVFFDDMASADADTFEKQVNAVLKKIIKKGGMELGKAAWEAWGLEGSYEDYLRSRVTELLDEIKIDHPDARIRAFKSLNWVYRWTSTNLVYFSSRLPMALPYYSDEIAKFITSVPEEYLAGRKIQVEYLKEKNPAIASIPWQQYHPLNLFNYHKFRSPQMMPGRAVRKIKRLITEAIRKKQVTTRNWEIQFLGEDNEKHLKKYLFENPLFSDLLPAEVAKDFYARFKGKDSVYYSHSVSMLLTLSMFCKIDKE